MIKDFLDEHHQTMKRGIADIWNALTETEKKLCIRYPFDALKVNKAKNIATSQTEAKFGTNGLGSALSRYMKTLIVKIFIFAIVINV